MCIGLCCQTFKCICSVRQRSTYAVPQQSSDLLPLPQLAALMVKNNAYNTAGRWVIKWEVPREKGVHC